MIGKVDVTVYYGTPYDWQNIPFHPYNIGAHAAQSKTFNGVWVWQTTWLNILRLNVENYNDIVGAQWVKMDETDPAQFHGSHYYYILDYVQVNQKTVQLTLQYDALLSLGVDNITAISGTLNRWTVADDSDPMAYAMTAEPINQAEPYDYSYQMVSTLSPSSGDDYWRFVGSPVLLSKQPEILNYVNENGEEANIFYPDMEPVEKPTLFGCYYPELLQNSDGLQYYFWGTSPVVQTNYSRAVGLGYNLVTNSYAIPKCSNVSFGTSSGVLEVASIIGSGQLFAQNAMGGYGLTVPGYNNAKAGAIGLFFTLYNTGSGSQITAQNYELSRLGVRIWCDPSSNGRFFARFAGYLGDTDGTSGAVPSIGWQPVTLSSSIGQGATLASINNQFDLVNAKLSYKEQATANAENMINTLISSLATMGFGVAQGGMGGTVMGISASLTMLSSLMFGMVHQAEISDRYARQKEQLQTVGTITTNTPPAVTYGAILETGKDGYRFHIRTASISPADRQRADEFFTAYGYNVDSLALDDVAMLNARMRFTYIMADDVRVNAGNDQTRVRDVQTMEQITTRFSQGIRIWQVRPDYDWSLKNETRGT